LAIAAGWTTDASQGVPQAKQAATSLDTLVGTQSGAKASNRSCPGQAESV
jgi:hypothetical protein